MNSSTKPKTKTAKPQSTRPKLVKIDDDMRRWSEAVEAELVRWPDVYTRPMFGMIAFYRGPHIFAALPRTRAAGTKRSILMKLPHSRDDRLVGAASPGRGWVTFEMQDDGDIANVLHWILRAYEKAAEPRA